ncbi:methionyl-tRNA formyltransferase [Tissierella praeacuta DSM 18095]|uniref:Methionyl-tRNA formyltransferase n=1 Tax=Tissierella praeacuta DSM 18095 TaxID=1123404 RepID=A0A1M4SQS0_9FIRM|nr:methionyl-tRNA formyltransferase [Tissierella praeacuta]SHE34536.1 methionyl-tRNA formyltransferase [Tissierella praeacuta DSM 18095]SUP01664.1 Methionyl-tRNA formyltransferase [Tissierella praeacuta]
MKIVFMGTPDFAVPTLKSLYLKGYSIELVITQKDKPKGRGKKFQYTPVKEKALELGLEVYQPDSINDVETINRLKSINPDFIVVVAYGQILKKDILEIPKYGCYNVHASLLPKYRGAAPINWVIINGEEETGVTIMEMEEGLDSGDMVLWESIPINLDDDASSIHDKLSELGGKLIIEALEGIKNGELNKTPQNHTLSTYAHMLDKGMGRINWNDKGENIINLIRGLKPWPSAYVQYKDEIVKIHKASLSDEIKEGSKGEIVKVDNKGIYVNSQDKIVVLEEIQFPGKKKLKVEEYLRGNSIEKGIILN